MKSNWLLALASLIVGALLVIVIGPRRLFPVEIRALATANQCDPGVPTCIQVSVVDLDGTPTIQTIGDVHVFKAGTKLTWKIDPDTNPDYSFADPDAIKFKAKDGHPLPPEGEFTCPAPGFKATASPTTFECLANYRVHGKRVSYAYTVTLVGPNGTRISLDPYIIDD